MGLGNRESKTYLKILFGKVCMSSHKEDPSAQERKNKNGDTVYERFYDFIEGKVTSIVREKSTKKEYPDRYCVDILSGDDSYCLQFSVNGKDAEGLLKAAPNVKFDEEVRFVPWERESNGVKKSGLMLIQRNQKVDWAYTKDHPNGLPQPNKVMFEGEERWDFHPQFKFLDAMLHKDIIPNIVSLPATDKFEGAEPVASNQGGGDTPPITDNDIPDAPEETDLPF